MLLFPFWVFLTELWSMVLIKASGRKISVLPLLTILVYLLGVSTTSRILTGYSQKLNISTLTKVPFFIFWSDKPPWRASYTQQAASAKLRRLARQSFRIDRHGPILINVTFLNSLRKIVRNMYHSAKSDESFFFKVGTPHIYYVSHVNRKVCWNRPLSVPLTNKSNKWSSRGLTHTLKVEVFFCFFVCLSERLFLVK